MNGKKPKTDEPSIFELGFRVAQCGGRQAECPFAKGDWKYEEWLCGFEYFSIWEKEKECG